MEGSGYWFESDQLHSSSLTNNSSRVPEKVLIERNSQEERVRAWYGRSLSIAALTALSVFAHEANGASRIPSLPQVGASKCRKLKLMHRSGVGFHDEPRNRGAICNRWCALDRIQGCREWKLCDR